MNRLNLFATILAASSLAASAEVVEVYPGALSSILKEIDDVGSRLDLKGSLDVRDLSVLSSLSVDSISLKQVKVNAFSSRNPVYLDRNMFPDDEIPDYIFRDANFKYIELPEGTRRIGYGAFLGSQVRSVVIPDGVTEIADIAFRECRKLTTLNIPASVTSIGRQAFFGDNKLEEINLSETNITIIPEQTFSGCSALKAISLPPNIREIEALAFEKSGITAFSHPTPIDFKPYALAGMSVLKVADFIALSPESTTGLFFLDYGLRSAPVTSIIAPLKFANAPIVDLNNSKIIEEASEIGDYAFSNTATWAISFLPGIQRLGKGVFSGSTDLKTISVVDLKTDIPEIEPETFSGIDQSAITLVVAAESRPLWEAAEGWNKFKITDDQGAVKELQDDAFSIHAKEGVLSVNASSTIRSLNIAATDGRILASAAPDNTSAKLHFSPPADGIILVVTITDQDLRRDKIIVSK